MLGIKFHQKSCLRKAFQAVNTAFFDCLLSNDYQSHQYQYERRLHVAKRHLMRALLSHPESQALQGALLEVMQLRYRVSDYAEFELCAIELRAIYQALSECFLSATESAQEKALSWLQTALRQFEGINEHVLRVSARDPFVYTLFLVGMDTLRLAFNESELA